MSQPFLLDKWLRLPGRLALLLGIGALSAAGANPDAAQAHTGKEPDRAPQQSANSFTEVRIWTEEGQIYLAEPGKAGEELCLGDTVEARHLRQLLEQHGATDSTRRVLLNRIILVGGGGCGFDWTPADKSRPVAPSTSNGKAGFGPAKPGNPHQAIPTESPGPSTKPPTGQAHAKG
jgi:hypothetical protein